MHLLTERTRTSSAYPDNGLLNKRTIRGFDYARHIEPKSYGLSGWRHFAAVIEHGVAARLTKVKAPMSKIGRLHPF
jgi:hypothetical protein